jgi:hypothetical protein
VQMGQAGNAAAELDKFIAAFPHLGEGTLIKTSRQRIVRAQGAKA